MAKSKTTVPEPLYGVGEAVKFEDGGAEQTGTVISFKYVKYEKSYMYECEYTQVEEEFPHAKRVSRVLIAEKDLKAA